MASLRKLVDNYILSQAQTKTMWCKAVPGKANILLWRVRLGKIAMRSNLSARGIVVPNTVCPICNLEVETESHLMFDSPCLKRCGRCSTVGGRRYLLPLVHLRSLQRQFKTKTSRTGKNLPLSTVFFAVCWAISNL